MLNKMTPYVFAFTLFVSAMLVFSVQPMLGKMMLPHVGGAPSGWAVTMFFFQTCLLFGYGLAYLFSKLSPLPNIIAIIVLFLIAAFFLPIAYKSGIVDTVSPWAVFVQLTVSTAIPFLALSTLSPGLQRLFSFSGHKTASDPYYLYAASNAGSFVGLLAYPFILEPLIGLSEQSALWMKLFFVLTALLLTCFLFILSQRRDLLNFKLLTSNAINESPSPAPTWKQRGYWLVLAAIPSSLMIGTTVKITTDVASAPMLWVLPLGLYLLTTITAFAKRSSISTRTLSALHLVSVAVLFCLLFLYHQLAEVHHNIFLFAAIYLAIFTITAQLLHSILANDRPKADRLTEFYLIMALGGAIGGSFNAFIAPLLFNDVYEFPLVLAASLLLNPSIKDKLTGAIKKTSFIIGVILITSIIAHYITGMSLFLLVATLCIFISSMNTRLLFISALIVTVYSSAYFQYKSLDAMDRNFFGVVKVIEKSVSTTKDFRVKALLHGTTLHGYEALDKEHAYIPSSYYATKGPVGQVYDTLNPRKIAVLGLGAGQLACYNGYKNIERETTFYEIDPAVIQFAKDHFTLLKECGYKDIILGDARLELLKDETKYDLIIADAFSSDSVPVHLITNEAVQLYISKIKNTGVVLFNISNNHINLNEPLAAIAKENNISIRGKFYIPDTEQDPYNLPAEWVVMTKNESIITALDKKEWKTISTNMRLWTDDYSNFISTLKMLKPKPIHATQEKEVSE